MIHLSVGRIGRVGYFTSFLVIYPQGSKCPAGCPLLAVALEEEEHQAPSDKVLVGNARIQQI